MHRVAITGIGSINALGSDVAAFDAALRAGRCGIAALSVFPVEGYRSSLAAQVQKIELPPTLPSRLVARASRSTALALVAADEAMRAANLDDKTRSNAGVVLGTTTGGMEIGEENVAEISRHERKRQRLSRWLESPVSAPVNAIAQAFSLLGPRLTISTACSSSANALGVATDWVRSERASAVLCGGTDALCRMTFSGFNALQAIDQKPCRPFDRNRAGMSLGEGAAFLVLEEWERASRRGAEILGEFVSYGISADAHHLTQPRPDGEGAMLAMRRALAAGGVDAEEVDYINAHGTGTLQNDAVETRAIKTVFGPHAREIPVSSTKSMVGHCLGAAGAVEALTCLLAMRGGFVPPTVNLEEPDPECDLDYVPKASRRFAVKTVLSNSYGFGGNNTSLILRAVQ